ncbi:MAG: c-type cytochrome [Tsuneonella suprasediminis]|nr:cytochrome c family protein [Altererythrobacter sp. N1]
MDDRFNTAAGWVLFSGIVALGLSSLSAKYFMADKHHAPHEMGYPVEGAADEGGADKGPSLAELLATADVAKGEKDAKARCGTCHTFDQGGANGTGPNLFGTVGEDIGHGKRGFAFSAALAEHGGKWTYENLDAWLASPKAFAPGTKMSFAGLSKGEDRANIILYLRSLGGGPELPTPEAKPAEGDAAAPADAASDAAAAEEAKAAPAEAAPAN